MHSRWQMGQGVWPSARWRKTGFPCVNSVCQSGLYKACCSALSLIAPPGVEILAGPVCAELPWALSVSACPEGWLTFTANEVHEISTEIILKKCVSILSCHFHPFFLIKTSVLILIHVERTCSLCYSVSCMCVQGTTWIISQSHY